MKGSSLLDLAIAGYLVALPVVVYGIIDVTRVPGYLYRYTAYSRALWISLMVVGYLGVGLGGVVAVIAWMRSTERDELRADWALERRWESGHPSLVMAAPPPRLALEPVAHAAAPTPTSRMARRQERHRRHRRAVIAVTLPVTVAVVVTAARVS